MTIPTRPPTANELRQNAAVQQALEQAWIDSLPHDAARRHEEGGWIYLNVKTGELAVRRAPSGLQAELEIGGPPLLADCLIVGTFHTPSQSHGRGVGPGR